MGSLSPFPPAPKAGLDWANLDMTKHLPVNGHVELRFHQSTQSWTSPSLERGNQISISGLCPGLNYGQQCYEGLKAMRRRRHRHGSQEAEETIAVFRPTFHAARMARSADAVCLPPVPEHLFLECIRLAVAANAEYVPPLDAEGFLYIRPVLFGASDGLPLGPCEETIFAVYCHPARAYHGMQGIKGLVCEEFDRAAPRGMGRFKVGGNYAPVWRHAGKAQKMGYHITLHLDSETHSLVEEFATSGFLGHKVVDGQDVLVVPESENAIESVTGSSLQVLAKSKGWKVDKSPLPFSSLGELDEVIAVGTAAAAVPIASIDRLSTGEKYVFQATGDGKLCDLARSMRAIQKGQAPDREDWCFEVTGF
ncbi:putative secondary metabolism biosynthetic enzyme [Aspergillus luchuensis]|uniref:Putative secondary metabolism biosynthetic enzyme n=1 Tax=Aspergillus kawachii TaxID=1069201 RepID=A0A7R7XAG4_ASPKA|nr:putative secondary metabolism biosynthetic enzyme [Aspergillus luchuensis]BCS05485.1 putative secondary metabolism biosynthetic enzyme [Aspergillus luchuensis]BCS17039.1 putative secondary metabolism biosynthetic enzyme [Aspergillus luchuensis]GAA89111.1 subgroup IIIi aminotransferase [Aspergillus luchuensis IFO 4308]